MKQENVHHHRTYCYCPFLIFSTELMKNSSLVLTETVGDNITFLCNAAATGNTTFLCKSPCTKAEDVLLDTSNVTAHSSRYSIEKKSAYLLSVTITKVTKSDTGLYKCGYGKPLTPLSSSQLQILIIDGEYDLKTMKIILYSRTFCSASCLKKTFFFQFSCVHPKLNFKSHI